VVYIQRISQRQTLVQNSDEIKAMEEEAKEEIKWQPQKQKTTSGSK